MKSRYLYRVMLLILAGGMVFQETVSCCTSEILATMTTALTPALTAALTEAITNSLQTGTGV